MAGLNDFLDDEGGDAGQAEAKEPSVAVEAVPVVETKEPEPVAETPPVVEEPEEIPEDLRGTREALIAERAKRKDWKGQAERTAGELTALRAELETARKTPVTPPVAATPPPEPATPMAIPNPVEDPQGYHEYNQRMLFNTALNLSESSLRRHIGNDADVDEKVAAFKKAADANPALKAELTRQPDPYQFVYNQGKRILALAEVGDDPASFRAKIEAEVRAKLEAEYAAAGGSAAPAARAAPALVIPRSLGTAASSSPRTLDAADTVPEFDDIFAKKKRA